MSDSLVSRYRALSTVHEYKYTMQTTCSSCHNPIDLKHRCTGVILCEACELNWQQNSVPIINQQFQAWLAKYTGV